MIAENPMEYDHNWTLVSANPKHVSFDRNFFDTRTPEEMEEKEKVGLAFRLDYFEHGSCVWSLAGEGQQCRWDTAQNAGCLVWDHPEDCMGAKTLEERMEDARGFLREYTAWCNGEELDESS